jgi:hypothetical protein
MSDTPDVERFPYPYEFVVGMFGDDQGVQRAVEGLRRVGFASDDYAVLYGAQDAESLDVTGESHGFRGRLIRLLQAAVSDDLDHVRHHAEHLRTGGYVVAIAVGKDETAKRRAAHALADAEGEFLNHYRQLHRIAR